MPAYTQRYVSSAAGPRAALSATRYRVHAIALSDRLFDNYFGRLFAALGVDNATGARLDVGSVHTAASHPLATLVHGALRTAIEGLSDAIAPRDLASQLYEAVREGT
ncbi:hypothetical protein LTR53_020089, partial [Teratosphaeriaceae sp. CCFEE 6253]